MLPRAASATVKSTATSAPASTIALAFAATCTCDAGTPSCCRSMPAWNGSIAATSSRSGASLTALHTVEPMRPPAPNTATRVMRGTLPALQAREQRRFVGGADDHECLVGRAQHAVDDARHVVVGDGRDARHDLVELGHVAFDQFAPTEPAHATGRRLERHRQRADEMALRGVELTRGQTAVVDERAELGLHDVERLVEPLG